jgi:hypothetical protein
MPTGLKTVIGGNRQTAQSDGRYLPELGLHMFVFGEVFSHALTHFVPARQLSLD